MNTIDKHKLNVNSHGNVMGIPKGWLKTNKRMPTLKRLGIPVYKSCIGFNEYKRGCYAPELANIIPSSYEQKIIDDYAIKQSAEKAQPVDNLQKVACAIYSINKEAKRQRDLQLKQSNSIWGYNYEGDPISHLPKGLRHYKLHGAKNRKEALYLLKEKALAKLIQILGSVPLGFHSFTDRRRDYYEILGFGFHANTLTSEKDLGRIEENISSERKRSMPPAKAEKLLTLFLSAKTDST